MHEKTLHIAGIVLSGGESSRMGTDKGLVTYKGQALISYAIEALSPFCEQVFISSNTTVYTHLGLAVIHDHIKKIGPIGGIEAAMQTVKAEYYAFIPCDTPNVPSVLYTLLWENMGAFDAILPTVSDRVQTLCCIMHHSCLPIIRKQIEAQNYKIRDLLGELNTRYLDVGKRELYSPELFMNINTKEDLEV